MNELDATDKIEHGCSGGGGNLVLHCCSIASVASMTAKPPPPPPPPPRLFRPNAHILCPEQTSAVVQRKRTLPAAAAAPGAELVGRRIGIYWPDDNQHFWGSVEAYSEEEVRSAWGGVCPVVHAGVGWVG